MLTRAVCAPSNRLTNTILCTACRCWSSPRFHRLRTGRGRALPLFRPALRKPARETENPAEDRPTVTFPRSEESGWCRPRARSAPLLPPDEHIQRSAEVEKLRPILTG